MTTRPPATEMKYFVLAIAALIGLGIGWLSGKAITSHLSSTAEPPAAVEPAVPATFAEPSESSTPSAEPSAEDAEAVNAQTAAPDAAVTQVATDDAPSRAGRRATRHAVRRAGRGNVFVRPFKALRRLRIW